MTLDNAETEDIISDMAADIMLCRFINFVVDIHTPS